MTTPNETALVRIDLTPDQKEMAKAKTGKEVNAIELTVQELETRAVPKVAFNHNETFLVDLE